MRLLKTIITCLATIHISLMSEANAAPTQKLDSAILNDQKHIYQYDSIGRLVSEQDFLFIPTVEEWNTVSKIEYSYDQNNNLVADHSYQWGFNRWEEIYRTEYLFNNNRLSTQNSYRYDTETNDWILSTTIKNQYDEAGNIISFTTSNWYSDLIRSKVETAYSNGLKTQITTTTWDNDTEKWTNTKKEEFVYNNQSSLISNTTYTWDHNDDAWINEEKTENNYNEDELLVKSTESRWSYNEKRWKLTKSNEYSYDENGNISELVYKEEYGEPQQRKTTYEYYTDQSLKTELVYIWDNNEWVNGTKTELTYSGEITTRVSYRWDTEDDWVKEEEVEEIEDLDTPLSDVIIPSNLPVKEFNDRKILQIETVQYVVGDPYTSKREYFYSGISEGVVAPVNEESNDEESSDESPNTIMNVEPEINKSDLSCYPNPTTDLLYFISLQGDVYGTVEIFNIKGEKVYEQNISAERSINIESIESGMYFYTISNEQSSHTGRFFKN